MSNSLRVSEKYFVVLALTFFSGVVFRLSDVGLIPRFILTIIKYSIWINIIFLNCIFWRNSIIKLSKNSLLFIFTGLVLISFLWSIFPNFTIPIAIDILIMTLFGLYFGQRFNFKEQVELLACTFLIQALMSTFFVLGFPMVGIDHEFHPGAWIGVFGQKNSLGSRMLLSSLIFLTLPKNNSILYKYFGFFYSLSLVLLSTSKSSLVMFFLIILIIMFYRNFKWRGRISVIFMNIGVITIGCIALLVITYWVEILTGLGRDPTLTGRTPMWGVMITKLMERPLLGYGLKGFWAPKSSYAVEVGRAVGSGWIAPNGHNGLLDLSLDVGLIGVSIFIINYFTNFTRALKLAYATQNPEQLWPLAFLTYMAMSNVTESNLLSQYNFDWVLYVSLTLALNKKSLPPKNKAKNKQNNIIRAKSYLIAN